jgi:hypothetical protein
MRTNGSIFHHQNQGKLQLKTVYTATLSYRIRTVTNSSSPKLLLDQRAMQDRKTKQHIQNELSCHITINLQPLPSFQNRRGCDVGAPLTRLRCPPRGNPTLPGAKEMPVLPLFFDTTPGLGATKLRGTFPYPFLHLRERFDTLAAMVIFSTFWAGKSHRHAKIGCVVVHHCHGVSPA